MWTGTKSKCNYCSGSISKLPFQRFYELITNEGVKCSMDWHQFPNAPNVALELSIFSVRLPTNIGMTLSARDVFTYIQDQTSVVHLKSQVSEFQIRYLITKL